MTLHPNKQWLFLISTEKTIRQFELPLSDESNSLIKSDESAKLLNKIDTKLDENVTCIELSKNGNTIYTGTNKGYLRIYEICKNWKEHEFRAHSCPISKICLTPSDECLIISAEDGTISFWQIGSKLRSSYLELNQSNEEVLISREDYLKKSKLLGKNYIIFSLSVNKNTPKSTNKSNGLKILFII